MTRVEAEWGTAIDPEFRVGLMGARSSPELVDLCVKALGEAISAQKA